MQEFESREGEMYLRAEKVDLKNESYEDEHRFRSTTFTTLYTG